MIKAEEQEIGSWSRVLQGSHRQVMMKDVKEQIGGDDTPAATRKGPWTAEEDAQLVRFVRLFGERRWDFLAKVSGLKRTGKSCRLRWVNCLHPGLRRGRITADEERLILELHAKWGSRWSRIARSLPGRTDNEIKNFWRTRARKKALEQRRLHSNGGKTAAAATSFSSSSSVTSGTSSGSPPNSGSSTPVATKTDLLERSGGGDEAELEETSMNHHQQQQQYQSHQQEQQEHCYTMDQMWNEMEAGSWGGAGDHGGAAAMEMPSPVWEFCSDYCSLWSIDDEEYYKMMLDAS